MQIESGTISSSTVSYMYPRNCLVGMELNGREFEDSSDFTVEISRDLIYTLIVQRQAYYWL